MAGVIISHRGNISGPNPETENTPDQILRAINEGLNVEVDIWGTDEGLFLGHDAPQYPVEPAFLKMYYDVLWIHCKNSKAISMISKVEDPALHYFWHENDDYTLTSQGYVWAYPGKEAAGDRTISVMPELIPGKTPRSYGICTDYPIAYSYSFQ